MNKPNRIQQRYSNENFKEELEKLQNEQDDHLEDPTKFFRQRHEQFAFEVEVI